MCEGVDMKHFAAAAEYTDRWYLTAEGVLEDLYEHEVEEAGNSMFDYDDLTSNLLGVYFEEYLESDEAKGVDFADAVGHYLKELGFSNNPMEDKPENNILPETHHEQVDTEQDKTYTPKYTSEERSGDLDKKIIKFAKDKTDETIPSK